MLGALCKTATATVRSGLSPGLYTVYAKLDGQEASLTEGFEVLEDTSGSETGCSGGGAGPLSVGGALALLFALACRRRARLWDAT